MGTTPEKQTWLLYPAASLQSSLPYKCPNAPKGYVLPLWMLWLSGPSSSYQLEILTTKTPSMTTSIVSLWKHFR